MLSRDPFRRHNGLLTFLAWHVYSTDPCRGQQLVTDSVSIITKFLGAEARRNGYSRYKREAHTSHALDARCLLMKFQYHQ